MTGITFGCTLFKFEAQWQFSMKVQFDQPILNLYLADILIDCGKIK